MKIKTMIKTAEKSMKNLRRLTQEEGAAGPRVGKNQPLSALV